MDSSGRGTVVKKKKVKYWRKRRGMSGPDNMFHNMIHVRSKMDGSGQ